MKNLKNQKGITLVALVVTIIVLLILAGVSLSLVAGGDGILSRAEGAVSKTEAASAGEQAELLIAELQTMYYANKYADEELPEGYTADDDISDFVINNIRNNSLKTSDGYKVEFGEVDTTTGKGTVTVKNVTGTTETTLTSREYSITTEGKIKFDSSTEWAVPEAAEEETTVQQPTGDVS